TSISVSDALPAGVTSFTWSGNGKTNQPGPLSDTIASLLPRASVTYTVVATIDPSATGELPNTGTVAAANHTNTANTTARHAQAATPRNHGRVTQDDGASSAVPGTTPPVTTTVTNTGPITATSISVTDALPAGVTGFSWSGSNGSSGTGALSDT